MRTRRDRAPGAATPAPTARDAWGIAVGAAGVAVLLTPLRAYAGDRLSGRDAPKFTLDSFPLSTYPMFSEDRGRAATVPHVVGRDERGRRILPHHRHLGGGGLNQVRKQVSRAVRAGRAADVAQAYADSLAAERGTGAPASARARREARIAVVEVVRARYRYDDWFAGRRRPRREHVLARCVVGGRAEAVDERRPAPRKEAGA